MSAASSRSSRHLVAKPSAKRCPLLCACRRSTPGNTAKAKGASASQRSSAGRAFKRPAENSIRAGRPAGSGDLIQARHDFVCVARVVPIVEDHIEIEPGGALVAGEQLP